MFEPVSGLTYQRFNKDAQALVVACPGLRSPEELRVRWAARAAAAIGDSSRYLQDVVRDLLANPHIRIVVFDGEACGRKAWSDFWDGRYVPDWPIQNEHLRLVRQFVDLYDDDFVIKTVLPPYWPARICYKNKEL